MTMVTIQHLSGSRTGQVQQLAGPNISIGRNPASILPFDPNVDLDVSTNHASIDLGPDGRYYVTDLNSRNGTLLNGMRIQGTQPVVPGSTIRFGENGPEVLVHYQPAAAQGGMQRAPLPPVAGPAPKVDATMMLPETAIRMPAARPPPGAEGTMMLPESALPSAPPPGMARPAPPPPASSRGKKIAAAAGVTVLLGAGIGLFMLQKPKGDPGGDDAAKATAAAPGDTPADGEAEAVPPVDAGAAAGDPDGATAPEEPASAAGAAAGAPTAAATSGKDALGDPLPARAVARLGTTRHRALLWPGRRSLAFIGDGSAVAFLGQDGRVRHGDVAGPRPDGTYPIAPPIAVSAAGDRVAGNAPQARQPALILDAASGQVVARLPVAAPAADIRFSGDGKLLALVETGAKPAVRVYDAATGKERRAFAVPSGENAIAGFSADGRSVGVLYGDATLRFLEIATGKELRKSTLPAGKRASTAIGPDLKLGVFRPREGAEMTVHDLVPVPWKPLRPLAGTGRAMGWHEPVFSADGTRVAALAPDGEIHVFETATGAEVGALGGALKTRAGLAISPAGRDVATVEDGLPRIREVATGAEVTRHAAFPSAPGAVAFAPDGARVYAAWRDGPVRVFDAATGEALDEAKPRCGRVGSIAVTPDGKLLRWACAPGEADPEHAPGYVQTFPLGGTEKLKEKAKFALEGCARGVAPLLSPDGATVTFRTAEQKTTTLDVATGRPAAPPGAPAWAARLGQLAAKAGAAKLDAVAADPEGRLGAAAAGRTIHVFDLEKGAKVYTLSGHEARIDALAVSPASPPRLASASADGTVLVWDVAR